jgi:hypothetical protein
MAPVTLNEIPEPGDDLEDYVAALFQAAGFFVEKNLTQRDPMEVLELDIVATDYGSEERRSILAEVKGGGWGFPDLFKLVGWMRYLDIGNGAFFVSKNANKDIAKVKAKMSALGVSIVYLDDFSQAIRTFESAGLGSILPDESASIWRYSYGIERRIARYLLDYSKSNPELQGPKAALEYHRLVSQGVFFANTSVERAHLLYEAYKAHPKLSLGVSLEMAGDDFDPHSAPQANTPMTEALQEGKHRLLQSCFYIEHRARLAILKAAVDVYSDYVGDEPPLDPDGSSVTRSLYNSLPDSFREGVSWLGQQPTALRYALLWQQFLWGWGGFILSNLEGSEYESFARLSGVPAKEVPTALEAFDRFFPNVDWFISPGATDAQRIKMMPISFHGLGVNRRRVLYGWNKRLSQVDGAAYTKRDLVKWNNAAVSFLK